MIPNTSHFVSSSWVTVDTNQARIGGSVDEVAEQQRDTGREWDGLQGNTGAVSGLWPQRKGHKAKEIGWDVDMYTVHPCLVSRIIKTAFEFELGKLHTF